MNMKITIHWTAGNLTASNYDKEHYHFIVDNLGLHLNSLGLNPNDNINCYDGAYVPHCGGCNTNNIGISIAGYHGYKDGKNIPDKECFEKLFKTCADLMIYYGIGIDEVKTHAERNPNDKIDFIYLPEYWTGESIKDVANCANFIRSKIKWYYDKKIA